MPGYGRWLGEQPAGVRFEFLRDVMQYMQWQGLARADRPWLLKSPAYGAQELEILEVFPDARFVMAHRSPLRTVPSTCTLVGHFRRAYGTSTPDPMLLMEHAAASMEAQSDIRRAHPDLPLLDLLFDDIVGDLETVVERVYAHAGMTLSDESRRTHAALGSSATPCTSSGRSSIPSPRSAWTRPSSATGCAATSSCSTGSPTDVSARQGRP